MGKNICRRLVFGGVMEKDNKKKARQGRSFDEGTHPGAYTEKYDIDNDKLDFVDSSDDVFIEDDGDREPANHASPPAADPPVPNQAHVAM